MVPIAKDEFIVIGIDFGTTFSGVAWAYSGEPEEIELVTSWDSELNHCSDVEKAPTQLYYGRQGEDTTWGYSVPGGKEALRWFKLLLLDERDVPASVSSSDQLKDARRLREEENKDPIDIIACYLRNLWNHSIDSIQRSLGAGLLRKCRFQVVITLPAIWPHYAQRRMKQAAKLSGMLDRRSCGTTLLRFISEPEAAALATLKDLSRRSNVKPRDTIIVCDAGGGTVDLISYIVETTEPFVVKECVRGDGDLCGGIFLDERFLQLIQKKFKPGDWKNISKSEEKRFLNDWWEHGIKPQFQNQPRSWLVDLPEGCTVLGNGGRSGRSMKRRMALDLSSDDILSVFSPIIDKIRDLVDRQATAIAQEYSKQPKYVILVGGFGRSRYLFDCLQASLGRSTTVLQSQGTKPWTAICRGAVVQGLTKHDLANSLGMKVESRIASQSYGVVVTLPWEYGKYLECDRRWSEKEQEYRADNQTNWFLKQGDRITDKAPVRQVFYKLLSSPIKEIETEIYCSSLYIPSTRKDSTVSRLCTVKWNQDIALESLPTWTNKLGKIYHRLNYEIEMTCEEGTLEFSIYHQGSRVGGRNVDVDYVCE